MIRFTTKDDSVTFAVRVQPRSARSEIAGEIDGALKIRLAAPPVDGAANEELIRFLAGHFRIPRKQVEIVAGTAARQKLVRLRGVASEDCARLLAR